MKKHLLPLSVGLLLPLASAHAALFTINNGVAPQPVSSGDLIISLWLGAGVATYNASNDPDLPDPGLQIFRVNSLGDPPDAPPPEYSHFPTFPDNTLSIDIPTGDFDYVVFHWGGRTAGVYQSFYIGDIGGPNPPSYTFNAPGSQGLGWYSVFSKTAVSVPDSGSTVALLGVASLGLAAIRRRLVKT